MYTELFKLLLAWDVGTLTNKFHQSDKDSKQELKSIAEVFEELQGSRWCDKTEWKHFSASVMKKPNF